MTARFDNILIPVDFSLNTEIAAKKAVELTGTGETVIHLLHVAKPGKNPKGQFRLWVGERELQQWRFKVQHSGPHIRVKTHLLQSHFVEQTIIEYAAAIEPDLIVIGKQHNHRRLPFSHRLSPDNIAQKSDCPVLTAKPGSLETRTKVIVLPIGDFLPERKLEWAVLLAKRFRAQVHLLAVGEEAEQKDGLLSQTFLRAYHYLREKLHHPVEYSAVTRHNPAKAALWYAERFMADIILVNPQTRNGIGALTGTRHISDLLNRDSRIQVLDVQEGKSVIL